MRAAIGGTIVGNVLCLHLDSGGNVQSAYLWRYGLDQAFGGQWPSPSSGEQAAMKHFARRRTDCGCLLYRRPMSALTH